MLVRSLKRSGYTALRFMSFIALFVLAVTLNVHAVGAAPNQLAPLRLRASDLVVELRQTGRGNTSSVVEDALVFRVRANNPAVGNRDGDGIRNVDMIILDSN